MVKIQNNGKGVWFIGDDWERLPITLVDEDDEYYFYEAESPGLSYFVITGESSETSTVETTIPTTGAVVGTETTVAESTVETTTVESTVTTTTIHKKIENNII